MSATVTITRLAKQMELAKQKVIPTLIGNEVVNFALDNFRREGYMGDTFEPWRKRKQVARKKNTRGLLIRSGRGRRSIRATRADQHAVAVGSDVPYMKAHNEGSTARVAVSFHRRKIYGSEKIGRGIYSVKSRKEKMKTVQTIKGYSEVKAHMRQMRLPKRQFLGPSQYLMARLKRVYAGAIIKAFNS